MKEIIVYNEELKKNRKSRLPAAIGFTVAVALLCAVCVLTRLVLFWTSDEEASVPVIESEVRTKYPVVVIDAGHGGIDGGAVGIDGSVEKNINLAVSKRLEAICRLAGLDCVMTRTEDRMLADESLKKHRKMHDLKNRLAVVDSVTGSGGEAVLISVHMNNFSSPKYSGLQVWYSKNNSKSMELARSVQGYAKTWLDGGNNREIKPATSAIYMLERAEVPAVLVECGFMSNPEECEKLNTASYQTSLATVIFSALCSYLAGQ